MKRFIFGSMILSYLLLAAGCTSESLRSEAVPTLPLTTTTTSHAPSTQTPRSTLSVTPVLLSPTSAPTMEPSPRATSTVAPEQAIMIQPAVEASPMSCNQMSGFVDIQQSTNNNSWRMMDFAFESADVLTFLMWSNRPYEGPTPTPSSGPPVELDRSRRVLLISQYWNLISGELTEIPATALGMIQSPCEQGCPLEVVSTAPNESVQLLQITDAETDYQGLWLASEDAVTNLVPYVPVFSRWDWSSDSQLFWLVYSLQDLGGETYGLESLVIDLSSSDSPTILFKSTESVLQSTGNRLTPGENYLAFSPDDKTVLSYQFIDASHPNPPNNELEIYRIDISQSPPQLLNTYVAHYPFSIDWSQTLQDFLVLEFKETGATLYTLNLDFVYEIPLEVIQEMPELIGKDGQIRTDFESEIDMMALYQRVERFGVTPDHQRVIWMSSNEAWAFSCAD